MDKLERVLMIQPTGVSGIWHYANALSRAVTEAGLEVVLATLFPFEDLGENAALRVRVLGKRFEGTNHSRRLSLQRALSHVDRVRHLFRVMTEFQPQIVHFHAPFGKLDFLYYRYLRLHGARIVYTAHDAKPLVGEGRWPDWARYNGADAILVHSSSCVRYLTDGGIEETKIILVPHGNYLHFCHASDLSQVQAKRLLGLPSEARVILFFGAIAPYKGLDALIEAFSRLSAEASDTYLVIAGEPLVDFTPYQGQIDRIRANDRVVLDLRYMPSEEFPKYFLSADVVVFPYRRISQSGVLQLAYGFGRPVVVTNVGGLAETVSEDHTGLIASAADPAILASTIRQLLSDPGGAAITGMRGRALAETKYSWRLVAQQVVAAYRSACGLKPFDHDSAVNPGTSS